jgi:capsular exopolysaccharide synthesis family protein
MNPLTRFVGQPSRYVEDGELSPTLASQLGNLAQSLAIDPARPRVIAVISTGRREGATSCTVSLGRHLARRHAKTLMVDANAHHPGLHGLCDVELDDGVSEVLAGERTFEESIKATAIPRLFVLTAGRVIHGETPLNSTLLRERVLAATRDFTFVLVDCPAVNAYESSSHLASVCDGTILVVEGGRTLRQSARAALQILKRANCNMLGVFINKRRYYIPRFIYERI